MNKKLEEICGLRMALTSRYFKEYKYFDECWTCDGKNKSCESYKPIKTMVHYPNKKEVYSTEQ